MKLIDENELVKRINEATVDRSLLDAVLDMNNRLQYSLREYEDRYPNIFIFGLPRSGTTLLSQIIAATTNLGYINNLIARFWENPQYGVYLSKCLEIPRDISFCSTHAVTTSISDVHEFGYFWASLLGHTSSPRLGENETAQIDWDLLKNKILSINHAFDSGVIYKNTLTGHYAYHLFKLFKRPVFLYIKRDRVDTAYSILQVRKKRYGSENQWWSMKPYEYDQLKELPPCEQIAAQMYHLEQDYEKQLEKVDPKAIITVDYRLLCRDPWPYLDDLRTRLAGLGVTVTHRDLTISYSTHKNVENDEIKALKHYLEHYYKSF